MGGATVWLKETKAPYDRDRSAGHGDAHGAQFG
jgi:hypothetical protein